MKLTYNTETGIISNANGRVAYMTALARDHNPSLGAKLAAGPEACRLLSADEATIMSKYHGQAGFDSERFILDYEAWRKKTRALLASIPS